MPKPRKEGNPSKVFIDSSVFFAAVLSPSGGSFRIFREARKRDITLYVTLYVITEVKRGLKMKYPGTLPHFFSFFLHFPIKIIADPSHRSIQQYINLLPAEDAPILAAAVRAGATYLVTLDKKHFLNPLKSALLPVAVVTPGEFIEKTFLNSSLEIHQ